MKEKHYSKEDYEIAREIIFWAKYITERYPRTITFYTDNSRKNTSKHVEEYEDE